MSEFVSVPHSVEAEMSVLGSMLMSRKAIAICSDILRGDDFYNPSRRIIFESIVSMSERGTQVDMVTLAAYLQDHGELVNAGGPNYLVEIAEFVPSVANAEYYAQIVLDRSLRRKLIKAASQIIEDAQGEETAKSQILNAGVLVDQVASRTPDDDGFISIKEVVKEIFQEVDDAVERRQRGSDLLSTGFDEIDDVLGDNGKPGGLEASSMYVIGAATSMGKTSLAMDLAINLAQQGSPGVIFSYEMSAKQIVRRGIASIADVPVWSIGRSERLDDYASVSGAAEDLHALPVMISDRGAATIQQMRAKLKLARAKFGKICWFVVDYIQLMSGSNPRNKAADISDVANAIKAMAKEFDARAIVLSQLSRGIDSRDDKRPNLSDLKESGGIEQAADVVMLIYRLAYYESKKSGTKEPPISEAEIRILKNRNGSTGKAILMFSPSKSSFKSSGRR